MKAIRLLDGNYVEGEIKFIKNVSISVYWFFYVRESGTPFYVIYEPFSGVAVAKGDKLHNAVSEIESQLDGENAPSAFYDKVMKFSETMGKPYPVNPFGNIFWDWLKTKEQMICCYYTDQNRQWLIDNEAI